MNEFLKLNEAKVVRQWKYFSNMVNNVGEPQRGKHPNSDNKLDTKPDDIIMAGWQLSKLITRVVHPVTGSEIIIKHLVYLKHLE